MKIKALLFCAAIAGAYLGFTSCSGGSESAAPSATLSVDSLMSAAPTLAGDTIEVEGLCSHLCRHGGRKAFLQGGDSTVMLRCEATASMGGAFAPDSPGKVLVVKGIVRENRIGEEEVARMEQQQAQADSAARAHEACDTEKKAQGQADIDTFEKRMADYRAKIAARKEAEGKDYLSFYYVEALSYTTQETGE